MKAVFKREVSALFGGLTGWLILASTPFMLGLVLLMVHVNKLSVQFSDCVCYIWPALVFTGVLCAAGGFSLEKRRGEERAWRMLPVSGTGIVLGRYLGMCVPFLGGVLIACAYTLAASLFLGVNAGLSLICMLLYALCGLTVIAFSLWASCFTRFALVNALVVLAAFAVGYYAKEICAWPLIAGSPVVILVILAGVTALLVGWHMFRAPVDTLLFTLIAEALILLFFRGKDAFALDALKEVTGSFGILGIFDGASAGILDLGSVILCVSIAALCLTSCALRRRIGGRRPL
ncbi:MAG: hypothetical protein J5859_00480 [Clostridia bacterium]|nr:hypothetical protein [Clostridia bacterium]